MIKHATAWRWNFLQAALLVFFMSIAVVHGAGDARPNIIFLFTDDQAYDTLGCYGNPDARTPNIDRLAERGIAFDNHYNTTAICMASRANVMTGLYEYKNGCNFMHGPMLRKIWRQSYPMLLREAGYYTGFGGKFGFAVVDDLGGNQSENRYENLPVGDFDVWFGGIGQTSYVTRENKYLARYADEYPHSTRAYGAAGRDFIRDAVKANKPFCLSIFFKASHRPTTPDPMFDEVYRETVFRKLPNYGREAGEHLAPQSRMGRQYPRFIQWGYHTDAAYQEALRIYHQQIYGIDYAVGMILQALEEQGVDENTVIVFSSDNGFFNGSHGLGSKVLPYEEGARVPLIVYDPRTSANLRGRRSESVTGNIDIAATILDLAGLQRPERMDGKSLMPIVRGERDQVREALPLIQVWGPVATHALSVVTEEHKFVYWFYGEGMEPAEELFDLKNDPYEMRNVAGVPEYHSVLASMREKYDAELSKWKAEAVPYNEYQPFGTLFDRSVSWSEKQALVPRRF